ncbi:unnamed protein product [Closterium sp. NIES-54]
MLAWGSEGLGLESRCMHFGHLSAGGCQRSTGDPRLILGKGYRHVGLGGYGRTDPLLNKPFYPNGVVVGILTWYQSEGLGFESEYVHFGHPSAGGCQRSTGDPRLILGKGYRHVGLRGYRRTDPLLNKPFYPSGLVTGILTWYQSGLEFESRCAFAWRVMDAQTRYLTSTFIPMARSPGGLWAHSDPLLNKPIYPNGLVVGILTAMHTRRGSLKDARLEDLVTMSLLDYEPDYNELVKIWRSYKKRRPFGNVAAPPAREGEGSGRGKEALEEWEEPKAQGSDDESDSDADTWMTPIR